MEIIDVYDKNGILVGNATKKEAHDKGLWHRAAHVWIFNSQGKILLQKRAPGKLSSPGKWDLSAAGHVSAGEDIDSAAARELFEELGLKADHSVMKKLCVRRSSKIRPNYHNNEFDHVYLLKFDGDISDLNLQTSEVESVRFVSLEELESEIKNPETYETYADHGDYYFEIIEAIRKELS